MPPQYPARIRIGPAKNDYTYLCGSRLLVSGAVSVCWLPERSLCVGFRSGSCVGSLLPCHGVTRRRSEDPILYECVRPAIGWEDVPDNSTLFLVFTASGRWLAIHAPRGSSHGQVTGMPLGAVAFASTENIVAEGEHDWRVQWNGEWSDMFSSFETTVLEQ
jgi:hypothetical protein